MVKGSIGRKGGREAQPKFGSGRLSGVAVLDSGDGPLGVFGDEGVGIGGGLLEGGEVFARTDIAEDDGDIAEPAGPFEAANGGAGEGQVELLVIHGEAIAEFGIGARGEGGLAGLAGPFIPWADIEAIVAAEEVVADESAVLERNGALVLDGEVADALAGVELVGGGDGPGGAGVYTAGAGAAAVGGRVLVGRKREGSEDKAEEEPLAVALVEEDGIFALPAEAGLLGDGAFEEGAGIDVGAIDGTVLAEGIADPLQFFEEDLVVILAEGVFGDAAAARRLGLVVVEAEGEDGARFGENGGRGGTAVGIAGQPCHVAVLVFV